MEFIDIYDDLGQKSGKSEEKGEALIYGTLMYARNY